MDIRHCADDSDQIVVAFGSTLDDGISVLLVLVCDPLNHAAQTIHIPSPTLC